MASSYNNAGVCLFTYSVKLLLRINLSWYLVSSKFSSYICEHWRLFVDCLYQKLLILTNIYYYTHYIRLTAFIPGHLGKPAPEKQNHSGKTNLDLLEEEIVSGSGFSWAICKSAPRSRQITMSAPVTAQFLQAGCPSCRITKASKH